ncbi:MAG TPA: hypothetical protein VMV72_03420 [Verrucomicrobiae bacterium]|nr:hypothetical protein [Verrucomicrobiae bacterium]
MKLLLLTGGLIGFGMGFGLGLVHEQSLPHALAHACIALYVGALLMRWWGRVWIKALQDAQRGHSHE